MKKFIFFLTLFVIPFVFGQADAHQPHDPVESLALSPNYAQDKSFFALLHPEAEFVLRGVSVLRSRDGGITFDPIGDSTLSAEDVRLIKY